MVYAYRQCVFMIYGSGCMHGFTIPQITLICNYQFVFLVFFFDEHLVVFICIFLSRVLSFYSISLQRNMPSEFSSTNCSF